MLEVVVAEAAVRYVEADGVLETTEVALELAEDEESEKDVVLLEIVDVALEIVEFEHDAAGRESDGCGRAERATKLAKSFEEGEDTKM